MEWLKLATGIALVLLTVREMFNDLFHPTQSGVLSEWVGKRVFLLYRRWPKMLPTAGPLSIALVIGLWALMLAVGFAVIYWATFPRNYSVQSGVPMQGAWDRWWWSFYYSLEMLTTLGLGDLKPNPTWLKILSACHTLLGFSFVTASITWIVLVFPAVRRMRTLARKATTLDHAEKQSGVPVVSPQMHVVIAGLGEEVIQLRVDLVHFPLLFYFYAEDSNASLPCALFSLKRFGEEGVEAGRDPLVRLTSEGLKDALQDLAELIGDRLECRDREMGAVFRTYLELHTPR